MPFNMNNISYGEFKNICRMCMLICDIKFVQDNVISEVFYKLTDIQFNTNDELPQQICLKCYGKINEINEFAFTCKRTHVSLLKCVNDFKNAQMIEEQEILEETFKTEEEITIDEHEIEFLKVVDVLKLKEVIEEDKNNELEENMIAATSDDQNIKCSEDDLLKLNTPYIKVENEEESDDNVNLNDSNEDTYSSDISVSSYMDSAENKEDFFKKPKDKHLKCDVCNRTFISFKLFKKHKSLPSCERPKRSEQHLISFAQSYNITSPMFTHSGEHPYRCEQCSKSFSQSSYFKNHMRLHSGERPYKCEQCSKSFSRPYHVKIHMRTHSGERPYKCEQCSKSFSQSSTLKNHMRMHSGERPYKCEQCSKSFPSSYHVKMHMRTHSGERPYKCEQCSKSYMKFCNLKDHMRRHSGERPYKCEHCSKSFSRSDTLKVHIRTHCC